MLSFLLASFLLLPLLVHSRADLSRQCGVSTPTNFEMMFKRNCRNLKGTEEKCNTAYSRFLLAFSNKSADQVDRSDYDPYFDTLPIKTGKNESLFWSGTSSLVKIISMVDEMSPTIESSETTISARIINDFDVYPCWCSSPGNPGLDTVSNCSGTARAWFWAQFSVRFAQAASGTIFFLADGERNQTAYDPSGFFGCYELVNLNRTVVKRLVTLNVHRKNIGENCSSGSLITLRQNATGLGLSYTCYDLYGRASNESQTEPLSMCINAVIERVQKGTESDQKQVDCNSGAAFFTSSFIVLLISMAAFLFLVAA